MTLTPEQRRHLDRDEEGYLPGESPAGQRQARVLARYLKMTAQAEANPNGLFNPDNSDPSEAEIADAVQSIIDRALAGHEGDAEDCPHPDCRRHR